MEFEYDNNAQVKYELKSTAKLGMFFLRNLWIYIIYIAIIIFLKIYEQDIAKYIPNIQNIQMPSLYILTVIVLFVITSIIYLKISISTYSRTKARKCFFYNTYLVYENPYAIIKKKDVTYENINKIIIEKNLLDLIFQTGTIRIKKAVEYDEGMAINVVENPKDLLNKIQEITKIQ